MIKRKRLWVPMIFESFVEAKLILSINFFPAVVKLIINLL